MRGRKVQKTVLNLVVNVALYIVAAFVFDAALIFLLGIDGWPVQVVNVGIAVVVGYRVSRWNARQDELEEKHAEVDS